jgi:hypothetical protein
MSKKTIKHNKKLSKNKKCNKKNSKIFKGGSNSNPSNSSNPSNPSNSNSKPVYIDIPDINITDTIFLSILDVNNCSFETYMEFMDLYEIDKYNLCVNKLGERTQSLNSTLHRDPLRVLLKLKYTLIYLYEISDSIKKHIIAFALIDTNELIKYNIIDLKYLPIENKLKTQSIIFLMSFTTFQNFS